MSTQVLDNPILDAKNILETDGWIVGSFKCDDTGKRCAVGALRAACGLPEFFATLDGAPVRRGFGGKKAKKIYDDAVRILADACDPRWRSTYSFLIIQEGLGDRTAAEQAVIDYNDGRAYTAQGRKAVLNRFAKAAAKWAA